MTTSLHVELVVCAAPLADRAASLTAALLESGWTVGVTASPNAEPWINRETLARLNQDQQRGRAPGEQRRSPRPNAVIVAPGTFNTLNKLRAGISDTAAVGVLNDALGAGVPILAIPMINSRLAGHPAWPVTYRELTAAGVTFLSPVTGTFGEFVPLASGTGDEVAANLDPQLLVSWLRSLAFSPSA